MPEQQPAREKPSLLANLAFNIVIPTLIMTKLSGEESLGPALSIVVALAFPVVFGLRDYLKSRSANFFSVLGIISVILTGGMSLLQLPPEYIAIKEAAIPGLLGLGTLLSLKTRYPLVRTFLYNEQILQVSRVSQALQSHGTEQAFDQRLKNASYMVAGSFFLSSVLNYGLAKYLLTSAPGTPEFTEQLGQMTALSFPVIALPSSLVLMAALYYLLNSIQKLTDLSLEEIFHDV